MAGDDRQSALAWLENGWLVLTGGPWLADGRLSLARSTLSLSLGSFPRLVGAHGALLAGRRENPNHSHPELKAFSHPLPLQAPATLKCATSLIVHADRGTDLKLSGTKRLVKTQAAGSLQLGALPSPDSPAKKPRLLLPVYSILCEKRIIKGCFPMHFTSDFYFLYY